MAESLVEARDVPSSLRFEEMLAAKALDRSLSKRERTRYVFVTIAARFLQDNPAQNPTVEYLLEQSGLVRSTFYNHFKDIESCVLEVLSMFFEYIEGSRVSSSRKLPAYDAIWRRTCGTRGPTRPMPTCSAIHRNAALCKIRERRNDQWAMKVVHVSGRRRGREFTGAERVEYAGTIRILITMIIETLSERYINNDALISKAFPDPDDIAKKISAIWYEVIKRYEVAPAAGVA